MRCRPLSPASRPRCSDSGKQISCRQAFGVVISAAGGRTAKYDSSPITLCQSRPFSPCRVIGQLLVEARLPMPSQARRESPCKTHPRSRRWAELMRLANGVRLRIVIGAVVCKANPFICIIIFKFGPTPRLGQLFFGAQRRVAGRHLRACYR